MVALPAQHGVRDVEERKEATRAVHEPFARQLDLTLQFTVFVEDAKTRVGIDIVKHDRALADRENISQNIVRRRDDLLPRFTLSGSGERDRYHPATGCTVVSDREKMLADDVAAKNSLYIL